MEVVQGATAAQSDFELDVSFVESAPVVADLMQDTSDNCTTSKQSACVTCVSD